MVERMTGQEGGFTFWTELARVLSEEKISANRANYMCSVLERERKYANGLTIADILAIDRNIQTISDKEMESLTLPHPPLAKVKLGNKYKIVWREEAERCGFAWTPYKSNAEMIRDGEM